MRGKRSLSVIIGLLVVLAAGTAGKMLYQDSLNKALFRAVRADSRDAIVQALKEGADLGAQDTLGQTPLHSAAYGGLPETVAVLLAQGARLDARDGARGGTPVHWAVINGKIDNLRLMLEKGANPDARDLRGMTPLHWAATALKINDFTKAYNIKILLEFGADPMLKDQQGRTPLDYAAAKGNAQAQALLEEYRP